MVACDLNGNPVFNLEISVKIFIFIGAPGTPDFDACKKVVQKKDGQEKEVEEKVRELFLFH